MSSSQFPFTTCGASGKAVAFRYYKLAGTIIIKNAKGAEHRFTQAKIDEIVSSLFNQFWMNWFPLANDIRTLNNLTERPGLGMTILSAYPRNTAQAQAASYLGPILVDMGILRWSGTHSSIEFCLVSVPK